MYMDTQHVIRATMEAGGVSCLISSYGLSGRETVSVSAGGGFYGL